MPYTVPFTFAAENGDQPASQLDSCNAALLLGVNNAFLVGTLAARPAPDGIGNGRYYFATDDAGGTLYRDNGAAWVKVSAAVNSGATGLYGVRGLTGNNNPGTPNTKFDFAMDAVQVFEPTAFTTKQFVSIATQTCDITVAGPAVNGRDQVAAFANGSWVYFYEIAKTDGTKGLLASARSWPLGPVALPGGYTLWAPLHAVWLSAGGALVATDILGASAYYQTQQSAFNGLSGTVENAVALATFIPPSPVCATVDLFITVNASNVGETLKVGVRTGVYPVQTVPSNNTSGWNGPTLRLPNVGQQVFFITPGFTRTAHVDVLGYRVSNGDS
jgi:hypothetical protein